MTVTDDQQERQVVSKQRVADHGEVYTAKREVNAMLDLVKEETERIDSRFLEPACGTGNFLVEILSRKMEVVKRRFARNRALKARLGAKASENRFEYDLASAQAVSSIYGIELLPDNVENCRERLFMQYLDTYRQHLSADASPELERCIKFLLTKNILCGDALTMLQEDGTPICFCEWTFIGMDGKVKRRDFELAELLRNVEFDKPKPGEYGNLFSDLDEPVFMPLPKREYPLTDYLKLPDAETA